MDEIIGQLWNSQYGGNWTAGVGAHTYNSAGEAFFYGAMYASQYNMWDDIAKRGGATSFKDAWDKFNGGKLTGGLVAGLYGLNWGDQANDITAVKSEDRFNVSYFAKSTGRYYDGLFQSDAWIRIQLNQILSLYKKQEYSDAKIFSTTLGAFDVAWGAKTEIIGLAGEATETLKYVKGVKAVSKLSFYASTVMSVTSAGHAWGTNNANKWGVTAKASLDITMAYIGLVGGPVGWVVSGGYFLGDVMGLWGTWGDEL